MVTVGRIRCAELGGERCRWFAVVTVVAGCPRSARDARCDRRARGRDTGGRGAAEASAWSRRSSLRNRFAAAAWMRWQRAEARAARWNELGRGAPVAAAQWGVRAAPLIELPPQRHQLLFDRRDSARVGQGSLKLEQIADAIKQSTV